MLNKAVFIDRDGTLNFDSSFINKPEDFDFFPFVYESFKIFKQLGYKIIIISNQSGVGRGYITEKNLEEINKKIKSLLEQNKTIVDDIFYCYYYSESKIEKYKNNFKCRKPNPGMILEASKKHKIDLKTSFMIGDRESDIGVGKNSGCKTILVKTGDGKKTLKNMKLKPDYIYENLLEFAKKLNENNIT